MDVKCKITKEVFSKPVDGFRVVSCEPVEDTGIALNKYGNFTLSGTNLEGLKVGKIANIEIELDTKSKFPASYILVGYAGLKANKGEVEVKPEYELEILERFMTQSQANYVNTAYPDFVYKILNGQEDDIDVSKIYNVGEVRLKEYVEKIKNDCSNILLYPEAYCAGITAPNDMNALRVAFKDPEMLKSALEENPYHVYIDIVDFSFNKADNLVMEKRPQFKDSLVRCKYACLSVLKENEQDGDSRLNANILAKCVAEMIPEDDNAIQHIVEVVTESEAFYYDSATKNVSIRNTYFDEKLIAENIKQRLRNPVKTPMKWEQYTKIDDFKLTEEQASLLRVIQENSIVMLTAPGGCVDCETEFFNGTGWKKISEYQEGDKVLQYNKDGTGELVEPWRYIKEPCDKMYHFETKYGLDMTLTPDHNVCTVSKNGVWHEQTMQEIYDKQMTTGFYGRFITSFRYSGKGINLTDTEIKLMCAVICDGSFSKCNRPDNLNCRFHIKKERKKKALRQLFEEYGKPWREKKSTAEGYADFYVDAPRKEKEFTPYWYKCNQHQLQVICDNLLQWDGNISETKNSSLRRKFSTSIEATANFVQFAYSACGCKATIFTRDRRGREKRSGNKVYVDKSLEYEIIITDRTLCTMTHDNRLGRKNTIIETVKPADGFKYCFTVPSHYLVLRRNNHIFITGNCGKTSSMKAAIRMLEGNGFDYTMLCPTGTAAKVLTKATGRKAMTIHMFLAKEMQCGDFLILEESSMLSIDLLAKLFRAIGEKPKLLFICDPSQLPSIGCGNIVHDILNANVVPTVNLTKIFRYNSSGLITVATDIRNGNSNSFTTQYDDYHYIEAGEDSVKQVVDAYSELLGKGYNQSDVLILTPFNKTDKGTFAINDAIQKKFNNNDFLPVEYTKDKHQIRFKLGDRVINKKNNYHVAELTDDKGHLEHTGKKFFVANGTIGVIRACYKNEDGKYCFAIEFEEGLGEFEGANIGNLLLGYAVTIHASQGNQAKAVIVLFDEVHKRMVQRNIEYVAATRSQKELYIIGNKQVIEDGMNIEATNLRDTWLRDMLKEEE